MIDSGAELGRNLRLVRSRIGSAAARAGRDPGEVVLVAATKGQPPAAIERAAAAGVLDFGENYVNELAAKRKAVGAAGLRWHFIGALQSSTAHRVADLADVVHSVGSMHAARRLASRADRGGRSIPTLVQVDFTAARNGVAPEEVPGAVGTLRGLAGIDLRGLMTLPPTTPIRRRRVRSSVDSVTSATTCRPAPTTFPSCPWECPATTRSLWRKALR